MATSMLAGVQPVVSARTTRTIGAQRSGVQLPIRRLAVQPVCAVKGDHEQSAWQQKAAALLAGAAAVQMAFLPMPAMASEIADQISSGAARAAENVKTSDLPSLPDVGEQLAGQFKGFGDVAAAIKSAVPTFGGQSSSSSVGPSSASVGPFDGNPGQSPAVGKNFDTDANSSAESATIDAKKAQNTGGDLSLVPLGDLAEEQSDSYKSELTGPNLPGNTFGNPKDLGGTDTTNLDNANFGPNEVSKQNLADLPNASKYDSADPGRAGSTFGNPGSSTQALGSASQTAGDAVENAKSGAEAAVGQGPSIFNKLRNLFSGHITVRPALATVHVGAFDLAKDTYKSEITGPKSSKDLGGKDTTNLSNKNLGPNEVSKERIQNLPNASKYDTADPGRAGFTFGNPSASTQK